VGVIELVAVCLSVTGSGPYRSPCQESAEGARESQTQILVKCISHCSHFVSWSLRSVLRAVGAIDCNLARMYLFGFACRLIFTIGPTLRALGNEAVFLEFSINAIEGMRADFHSAYLYLAAFRVSRSARRTRKNTSNKIPI
jgi:hypothetical protein